MYTYIMLERMHIHVVVCMDENRGIGYQGRLLYSIKEDMKHFYQLTVNKVIVYGHKTLNTFPAAKPLPKRQNIVLSKSVGKIEGCAVVRSMEELEDYCCHKNITDLYVIGGESIYRQLLPYTEYIHMTYVYAHKQADRFFPKFEDDFILLDSQTYGNGDAKYAFMTYKRKTKEREYV